MGFLKRFLSVFSLLWGIETCNSQRSFSGGGKVFGIEKDGMRLS
jgi:hypothetical protein